MWQRQCAAHHADTQRAYKGGHEQAMRTEALAQCQNSQKDGEAQPNLMDHGVQQYAPRRRKYGQQNRGYQAMQQAQSGDAEAQPVPTPFLPYLCHGAVNTLIRCTLQHYIAKLQLG